MTNDEIEQALEQMKTSIAEIEKQLGIDINVEHRPLATQKFTVALMSTVA